MIQLLANNPLLLLFLVAAIGYPLGRIKIGGTSLGVAAVLFVGLAIGSISPDLKLPDIVYQLGLVLFVYTIGLSSGSLFFSSFRHKGLRDNLLIAGVLVFAAGLTLAGARLFHIQAASAAGLFAGSLTNTPALAAVLEHIKVIAPPALYDAMHAQPVVAYSLTYPMGVIGMIVTIYAMRRLWKVDLARENDQLRDMGAMNEPLYSRNLIVTQPSVVGHTISDLVSANEWNVLFGRIRRDDQLMLANGKMRLELGDCLSLLGTREDLDSAVRALGEPSEAHLELDLNKYDRRRIFVSSHQVAGKRVADLDLSGRWGALVTRVRRGDMEIIPHGDTVLMLGDQVRVVASHECMDEVVAFFGDSYRAVSEIDILTFGLGLAVGLLVGLIPIPVGGGITIELGIAGGPLLVALVLGALGRTGPMIWSLPYSANLTLRQIGLIFFLAGVGVRSGYAFVSTLVSGSGTVIFIVGTVITILVSLTALWVGYRLLKIPYSVLMGILAGMQTQPAVLGFALEQTHNEMPNVGYATVYPVATILKIVLAQVVLTLLV
ncbi:MAG: aspartate:alanine exchanger family transporter [Anaerolineaceae bacterium]